MSRRSDRREKLAQQTRESDLQWLLAAPQGRRIVAAMVESSGLGTVSAFTGNSGTFYTMGRHDFVQRFVNELREASLTDYRRMEDEAIASLHVEPAPADDDDAGT